MAQRADVIRHDIEDTRTAMTMKLALLEGRVLETVADTQASVEKIMEDVRGTVADVGGIVKDVGGIMTDVKATVDATLVTVDTTLVAVRQGAASTQASVGEIAEQVKGALADSVTAVQRTFNVPLQVQQHPWPMVGGALLVGYLFGRRGGSRTSATGSTRGMPGSAVGLLPHGAVEASSPASPVATPVSSARPQPGIVSGVLEQLKDEMRHEITTLTRSAIGVAITMLHEMFKPATATVAAHSENAQTQPGGPAGDSAEPQPASRSGAALNGVPS